MTFNTFWYNKLEANPLLKEKNTVMKISAESFRKELEKAFRAGEKEGDPFSAFENFTVEMDSGRGENPSSLFHKIFGFGGKFDKIFGGQKYQ